MYTINPNPNQHHHPHAIPSSPHPLSPFNLLANSLQQRLWSRKPIHRTPKRIRARHVLRPIPPRRLSSAFRFLGAGLGNSGRRPASPRAWHSPSPQTHQHLRSTDTATPIHDPTLPLLPVYGFSGGNPLHTSTTHTRTLFTPRLSRFTNLHHLSAQRRYDKVRAHLEVTNRHVS